MKSGTLSIIGRPNSGKSTLLNALVGQKISIVSAKPQTTRHRILAIHTETRGQIAFLDTPGIHKPKYRMNRRMLRSIMDSLHNTDLILHVMDASISFGGGEIYALDLLKRVKPRAFLLLNKIDKIRKSQLLPLIERCSKEYDFLEIIPLSALMKDNLDLLLDKIFEYLPERTPLFDGEQVTDRTERFLTAEFIREKILERTHEELPYTTAVIVRKFDESRRDTKNLIVIEADIIVEKKSQQGIILGAGGTQLRNLGISARHSLEGLLGCKVFLGLTVRTSRKWRDNDRVLDELEVGR